jgi:hypothetical protein
VLVGTSSLHDVRVAGGDRLVTERRNPEWYTSPRRGAAGPGKGKVDMENH